MQNEIQEIMRVFEERVEKKYIKEAKPIDLIKSYHRLLIQSCDAMNVGKRLNSVMILRLLVLSGDDAMLDGSAAEFQKAYRSWGVIYSRGMGSYDSIMWNLMHKDELIWQALEENGII